MTIPPDRSTPTDHVRVHELAREHGITSRTVLQELAELGFYAKSASSTIPLSAALQLRQRLASRNRSNEHDRSGIDRTAALARWTGVGPQKRISRKPPKARRLPGMDTSEGEPSAWDRLSDDVSIALSAVLDNDDIPPHAIALYARWWQLETWLRSVAYVELRSRDGLNWSNSLDIQAENRRQEDKQYEYMASPDWDDPLAYLDASRIFALIEDNWELFEPVLPGRDAWTGRKAELLSIRNRIGHLRRPHRDDLKKLEQTLRDLEHGAFRAVSSYNQWRNTDHLDQSDPVVAAFKNDQFPGAQGLLEHALLRCDTSLRLSYTVRPWTEYPKQGTSVTGRPGILWNVGFYPKLRDFNISQLWGDLSPLTRQLLIHLLVRNTRHIGITFPTVENSELVTTAIGDALQSVLHCSHPINPEKNASTRAEGHPLRQLTALDSRVQLNTAWSSVDERMSSITLFGA